MCMGFCRNDPEPSGSGSAPHCSPPCKSADSLPIRSLEDFQRRISPFHHDKGLPYRYLADYQTSSHLEDHSQGRPCMGN